MLYSVSLKSAQWTAPLPVPPGVASRFPQTLLADLLPLTPKPRRNTNGKNLFNDTGESGGSGWCGSIRLVKLVSLLLRGTLGIGSKDNKKQTNEKTSKAILFHSLRLLYKKC